MEIKVESEQEHDEFERIEKLNRLRRTNDGQFVIGFDLAATRDLAVTQALRKLHDCRIDR